jgi:DNA polymerase-1
MPVLTVHDEYLFEVADEATAETVVKFEVKKLMESVTTLSVPLVADVGVGKNWEEAKE